MATTDDDRNRLAREKHVAYGESNVTGIVLGMVGAVALLAVAFFVFYDRNPPSGTIITSTPPIETAPQMQQKTIPPSSATGTPSPPSQSSK